jgi:hypothetical protein
MNQRRHQVSIRWSSAIEQGHRRAIAKASCVLAAFALMFVAPTHANDVMNPTTTSIETLKTDSRATTPFAGGLVHVDIAEGHDTSSQAILTVDSRPMTLTFWSHSVRSESFRVLTQVDDGSLIEAEFPSARTIRGEVAELPGSIVAGAWLDDGLHARIVFPSGRSLWIEPSHVAAGTGWHVVHDQLPQAIATPGDIAPPQHASTGIECMIARTAFDADYPYYLSQNSSVENVVDRIETLINAVNIQYENEVGIIHEIAEIVIRTSPAQDPYTTNDAGMLLQQFRNVWNAPPEDSIDRALAILFTGRNLNGGVTAISFLSAVCDIDIAYGVTRDLAIDFPCMTSRIARLLGHLWSASTCDCPDTTMHSLPNCANTFIGPGSDSVDEILDFKDTLDCLEPCTLATCGPDLNGDGLVNTTDLLLLFDQWGTCDGCTADFNGDGVVNVADLLILFDWWGDCP